jgi:hypothetical protein
MKKLKFFLIIFTGVLFATLLPGPTAQADVEFKELGNVLDKALLGFEAHTFIRVDTNPWYGTEALGSDNNSWAEVFTRLHFTGIKEFDWATLEAKVSPVFMATMDQDVYGLRKDDQEIDLNQGYIKFGQLFNGPFDLTVGMQDVKIEKQFLIGILRFQDAANWLLFHDSAPFAIRLDGKFGAMSSTVFWARTGPYFQAFEFYVDPNDGTFKGKDDVEVAGINLHYDFSETAYFYAGYYAKIDNSRDADFDGDGLTGDFNELDTQNFSFGGDFTFGGFNIEGEGVYQFGDVVLADGSDKLDRDALGGFVAASYTFPAALSPFIKLHYVYYPGDDNPGDDDVEEFDPMFWGFPDWNRWVIGELVGEAHLPNMNKVCYIIEVGITAGNALIHAMYIKHEFAEPYNSIAGPLAFRDPANNLPDDSFADEYNLLIDWPVNDFLFAHFAIGYTDPDDGAAAAIGGDDGAFFAQAWFMFAF